MPRNLQGQTVVLVTSPLIFSSSGCQHCINTRTPYWSSTHVNRDLQQTSDNFAIEFYTKKFDKIPLQSFTEKLFEASEQNVNARFSINQHAQCKVLRLQVANPSKNTYRPCVRAGWQYAVSAFKARSTRNIVVLRVSMNGAGPLLHVVGATRACTARPLTPRPRLTR